MKMIVNLKEDSYPIYIENNIVIKQLNKYINQAFNGTKIVIITDSNVQHFGMIEYIIN